MSKSCPTCNKDCSPKVCTFCKVSLCRTLFNKDRYKADGYRTYCRECGKKKAKDYYQANKAAMSKMSNGKKKVRKIKNQQCVFDYLAAVGCTDCGNHNPYVLDFDHLMDKKHNVSQMINQGYSLNSIMDEIGKCAVRCANCHRKKTAVDQNWYAHIDTRGFSPGL